VHSTVVHGTIAIALQPSAPHGPSRQEGIAIKHGASEKARKQTRDATVGVAPGTNSTWTSFPRAIVFLRGWLRAFWRFPGLPVRCPFFELQRTVNYFSTKHTF